jgi:phosphoribosylformylglycinamidine (FGAM) synthase-like amidotransferase family enzyme
MFSKLKVILGVVLIISGWSQLFVAAEPLNEYVEARNMYLFAAACRASYDDTIGHMALEALESNGWHVEKYFTSGKNANTRFLLFVKTQPENGEPMYLIAVTGTETAQDLLADLSFTKIIFKGHSIQEIKDNARHKVFSKKVPLVHWGFFQYALSAWEMDYHDEKSNGEKKLIRELMENPSCKIYLVGHSLGGAVVTLGAAGLISSGIDPSRIEVVSFGAPAVGNDAFRHEFESKINLTRVVMHGDPIVIMAGRETLAGFCGLAAGGGFSYGDVLGAGEGWAKSILFNPRARDAFTVFFQRPETFALGICNGCQMMSNLHEIIPGTEDWPHFVRNRSEQFEARLVLLEVQPSSSLFFAGMAGSRIPVALAHGEGYAEFRDAAQQAAAESLVTLRFVDNRGATTERYPYNPNGSPQGITGVTTADGRFSILMPHPERVFRTAQMSWHPDDWGEDSPWMRMFRNARRWIG